jgi:lysophospholipase L1-like esterase
MVRPVAALTSVLAVVVFFGACAQSPTAPTSLAGSVTVGSVSQEPTAVPTVVLPSPGQALGATRFLAFGDSITAGVQSSFDAAFLFDDLPGSYPSRLLTILESSTIQSFRMINEGRPGERARDGEQRLRSVLASLMGASANRPEGLLLLEGINDMNNGDSAARAASSVAQLAEIGRLYNLTVLVATMPQTYGNPMTGSSNSADLIAPFNAEVRRLLSGRQNVYIVDIHAAFGANRTLMGADGLHPTPAGYAVMAQQFHAAIVSRFPVRGSLQ